MAAIPMPMPRNISACRVVRSAGRSSCVASATSCRSSCWHPVRGRSAAAAPSVLGWTRQGSRLIPSSGRPRATPHAHEPRGQEEGCCTGLTGRVLVWRS